MADDNSTVADLEKHLALKRKLLKGREIENLKLHDELTVLKYKYTRLAAAVERLNPAYWMGVSECNCSSELPTGGCLHCELKDVKDAIELTPLNIPMCWKCSNADLARSTTDKGAMEFVGCFADDNIKCYKDAETMIGRAHV